MNSSEVGTRSLLIHRFLVFYPVFLILFYRSFFYSFEQYQYDFDFMRIVVSYYIFIWVYKL
jgi:hypothetical protein